MDDVHTIESKEIVQNTWSSKK